jgi:hypothetical protein
MTFSNSDVNEIDFVNMTYCQDCKHFKPWRTAWSRDTPKCPNPDGIVFVRVLNNCKFFVAKE